MNIGIERALSVFGGKEQCPTCEGEGWLLEEGDDGEGYYAQQVTCATCHGNGWIEELEPCIVCGAPVQGRSGHDDGCPIGEDEVR